MQRLIVSVGLLLFLACPVVAAPSATTHPDLQVEVLQPPSVDPLHEDDVTRFFVDSVRETFRRRGYTGKIDELYFRDKPREDAALLTIRLTQWRRNRTGGVDCTFSATIRPPSGPERALGTFTGSESGISITNRWHLTEAFRDAASRGAEELWRRLERLEVLPGVSNPRG
jgi:hypothetical protein